jgi:tetratricopeptide (TPR) repeat protein
VYAQFAEAMARRNLNRNHLERASRWISRAGGAASDRPTTLLLLCRIERKNRNFEQAAFFLDRAQKSGLSAEIAQRERYLLNAQAGQMHEVEKHLGKLLQNPGGDEAEICEAFVHGYRASKRFQRASEILDAWQADFPLAAQPHYLRGTLWQDTNFLDLAEAEYRRAIELQSDHAPALLSLANALQDRQALREALQTYQRLTAVSQDDLDGRIGIVSCLRQLGRIDEARRIYAQLDDSKNNSAVALEGGMLDFVSGNYDEAINKLELAYAKAPQHVRIRRNLALALAGAGRVFEAQTHFAYLDLAHRNHNRIQELSAKVFANSRDTQSRMQIAKLFMEIGSETEALQWLYGTLEVDPRFDAAHQMLADFYEANRKANPAYEDLARRHRLLVESSKRP